MVCVCARVVLCAVCCLALLRSHIELLCEFVSDARVYDSISCTAVPIHVFGVTLEVMSIGAH